MVASGHESKLTVVFEATEGGLTSFSVDRGTGAGRVTDNISSWTIESDYLVSTDGFEFEMFDENPDNLRNLEGKPVLLVLNGATQLIGRIDSTERGRSGRSVICKGRDYIADLVECNIDPSFVIKEGETLGDAIVRSCRPIGITAIDPESSSEAIVDARKGIGPKTKTRRQKGGGENRSKPPHEVTLQDLKPDIGQGIYEFWKPVCDRHDCTIQPGARRDSLLIAGPIFNQDASYAITRLSSDGGVNNNVVSATATRNYSSFPTMTIVQGQGAPRSGETTSSAVQVIDAWAQAQRFGGELAATLDTITWSGRRKPDDNAPLPIDKIYRLNVYRDDKARSKDQIERAAKKLFTEHLRKSLEYRVTLRGHVDPNTGLLWTVNTMVQVDDDPCDIHEKLWIQSRTFRYRGGATTDLVCIRAESFNFMLPVQPVANAGAGKNRGTGGPNPDSDARKRNIDRLNNPQNVPGALLGPPAIPDPTAIRQSPDNFVPGQPPSFKPIL